MIGTALGPYRVLERLGAGGMGEVYLADDERLHRRVALKVLPPAFASDADRVHRFEREARAVSALNHPNILTLFDIGNVGGRYFIVTEFIDGRTLRAHLRERGSLPPAEAIAITLQCAGALTSAHAAGVVHRDIKPENVMIRQDGYIKLLDFGLVTTIEPRVSNAATTTMPAALTSPGMLLGTVGYLSPEQARGQSVDARTDIFSLAVVLYEMLTGISPFPGPTPADTLAAVLQRHPPPLGSLLSDPPEALEPILSKALAKDRDSRYPTVVEFSQDLDRLARDLAFEAHPRSGSTRAAASHEERPDGRRIAILAGAALIVLAMSTALWWSMAGRTPAPPAPASAAADLRAIRTLAVLPFQLLGYHEASEYLGLGMADALIVKLSVLRQMTVRPTTAVQKYQAGDQDVVAVGRALQVDAVLMGNVHRDGGRTRVTVQLIRTSAGADPSTVWSDAFTTSTSDPFAVQDRLATELVEKLALRLTGDEQAKLIARDTSNPRARQLYMEGRFFASKRTAPDLTRALQLFEEAAREDPTYARAQYGQALALNSLIENGALSPVQAVPKVQDFLDRALTLDPAFGEAYGLRSLTWRVNDWRFDKADRDSEQSMNLDPNNPAVLQWRGVHLLALGRTEEAIASHTRAVEIDPVSLDVRSLLCRAQYLTKRYEEAVKTGHELIAFDPTHSAAHQWLGLSLMALGRSAESLSALKQAVTLSENSERLAALAYAYAVAERPSEARKLITALAAPRRGIGNAYHIATVYAGLGDSAQTLQWLDRAWRERDGFLPNRIKLDPKLDPLREQPRFQDLLKELRLDGQ